jgi:hypothetical protein
VSVSMAKARLVQELGSETVLNARTSIALLRPPVNVLGQFTRPAATG